MTRWARANDAHKKTAEEATKWEDMWKNPEGESEKEDEADHVSSQNDAKQDTTKLESGDLTKKCPKCGSNEHDEKRCLLKRPTDAATTSHSSRKRKPCFKCRQLHSYVDCPLRSEKDQWEICFQCGSTEHTLRQCKKPAKEVLKFARCFICDEMGHISKDCPQNKNGIYINGGGCNICEGKDHLSRNCPKKKKAIEENEFVLTIQQNNESVEVEDLIFEDKKPMKTTHKIVKFK